MPDAHQFGSFHHYDSTNLFIVKPEISISLTTIENTFSDFTETLDNAEKLTEAEVLLTELHGVFEFLQLSGVAQLCKALHDMMQQFSITLTNTPTVWLELFAEGLMLLTRYIEFVQLRQTVVPNLLLTIINNIRSQLQQPLIHEGFFFANHLSDLTLRLPNQPPNLMPINEQTALKNHLRPLYKQGLLGILSKKPSTKDYQAVERAVFLAYMLSGNKPTELFWHTAYCAVQQLADCQPISDSRKRVLILIEQQLAHIDADIEQPIFIDILAMGLCRDNASAKDLREQLQLSNKLTSDLYAKALRGYIFGPTYQTIHTVSELIIENISTINNLLEELSPDNKQDYYSQISHELKQLSAIMQLLNIPAAHQELLDVANMVATLTQLPDAAQINLIVQALLHCENATVLLEKSYIPGGLLLPSDNINISQMQLNQSFNTLITQSLSEFKDIIQTLNNLSHPSPTQAELSESLALTINNLSGALEFMHSTRAAHVLKQLASHIKSDTDILTQPANIENIGICVTCIEYMVNCLQNKVHSGERPITMAEKCLSVLMAA